MIGIVNEWEIMDELDGMDYHIINSDDKYIVLKDDGFLPDYMISPYRYYVQLNSKEEWNINPIFADLLKVPDLWEIRMGYDKAEVWDEGIKKAEIEYATPIDVHNVKVVSWIMPGGRIYKLDHYDKYGNLYYDELLDEQGEVDLRTYYAGNKPVLFCQPKMHLYTMIQEGKIWRQFDSEYSFLHHFINQVFPEKEEIISSDESLVTEMTKGGFICKQTNRFEFVFPKKNYGNDAYVLTHSDQVEQIQHLIVSLPEINFHIAAITVMSDKLLNLNRYSNVSLYQGISEQKRKELLRHCTYYLDINHYQELFDVVYEAYRHCLLIIGFDNTLHNADYVLPECVFPIDEADKMIGLLKSTYTDNEYLQGLMMKQCRLPLAEIYRG